MRVDIKSSDSFINSKPRPRTTQGLPSWSKAPGLRSGLDGFVSSNLTPCTIHVRDQPPSTGRMNPVI